LLFGAAGFLLIGIGLGIGLYIIYLWQTNSLNPNRPLMTLMVLLLVSGLQVILFGFLGTQMVGLRKEIYRIQNNQHKIEDKIEGNKIGLSRVESADEPEKEAYQISYEHRGKTASDH